MVSDIRKERHSLKCQNKLKVSDTFVYIADALKFFW